MKVSRRSLLRGSGAALGLPLLPSLARAAVTPPRRVIFVQWDNGAPMDRFTPASTGRSWTPSECLEPLADHRQQTMVITGLANEPAAAWSGGNHHECFAGWLTCKALRPTNGLDNDTSVDQLLVPQLGAGRVLDSLQVTTERADTLGLCSSDLFPCAYELAISWESPTRPLLPTADPRQIYDRVFPAATLGDPNRHRSALDVLARDADALLGRAGAEDRLRLQAYLDGLSQLERRLRVPACGPLSRPEDEPEDELARTERVFDVVTAALACDAVRVVTITLGRARPDRIVDAWAPLDHHQVSHHAGFDDLLDAYAGYTRWLVARIARLADRLAAAPEGEGTLLDSTLVVAGSGMGDGFRHEPRNLPLLLIGGWGGLVDQGRHLQVYTRRPVADLWLGMLHAVGDDRPRFGEDGTDPLDLS